MYRCMLQQIRVAYSNSEFTAYFVKDVEIMSLSSVPNCAEI